MVCDVGAAPQKCKEVKACCAATARRSEGVLRRNSAAVKSHLPEQAAEPLRNNGADCEVTFA